MDASLVSATRQQRSHEDCVWRVVAYTIDTANGEEGEDPICDLCGDGEQTSQHIIGECGALTQLRLKYFNAPFLLPPFVSLKRSALTGFLREVPVDAIRFFVETKRSVYQ